MTENECLSRMISPGMVRPNKPAGGVIQIIITSSCNLACFNCTQASQLARKPWFITPEQFEQACLSLHGYFGTVGVFGGNPCVHKDFPLLCEILRKHFPKDKCGLWSNNLMRQENGEAARITFSESRSNLNVHLDREAYELFRQGWPEAKPFGLYNDSRHSPPYVAMKDVLKRQCTVCYGKALSTCSACNGSGQVYDESTAWELISNCDINQHWSAMIGVFRGQLRAWFCEVAGAQAMLHQHELDYPDTGLDPTKFYGKAQELNKQQGDWLSGPLPALYQWWQLGMNSFASQVRLHCHSCGVPLRGHGELAQARDNNLADMDGSIIQEAGKEQVSAAHEAVYKPKRKGRKIELVMAREQLGNPLELVTDYVGNARR